MDTDSIPIGTFSSVFLVESPLSSPLVSCITSIYSFNAKILETKQTNPVNRSSSYTSQFIYKFEFVHEYWTAFLNGVANLKKGQGGAQMAMESISMVQVNSSFS